MSIPDWDAWSHFFKTGMEYYIAGRAAARGQLIMITGNLLHHAVELLLKGELSKTVRLRELKGKTYGHCLVNLWNGFKAIHPSENLSRFDQVIAEPDRFEKIRYPNEYLEHGAQLCIAWGSPDPMFGQETAPRPPVYVLRMNEVDELVARLFKVSGINPRAYWGIINSEAVRYIQFQNCESAHLRPHYPGAADPGT